MKEWIVSVGAVILITSIATLILPSGKTSKLIKGVFSILITIVIFSPIISIKNGEFSLNFTDQIDEIIYQEDYINFTNEKRIKFLQENCRKILTECEINGGEVLIEYTLKDNYHFSIKSVKINLENAVINKNEQRIYIIEAAIKAVSEYLSVDKGVIYVYE